MAQEDRKTPTLQQWVAAVMHTESRGNPRAVSPVGAVGTMQTMPYTLRDPGFGVVPARDDSDTERERVGVDYLKAMLNRYDDPRMALAAYNWGPGRVDNALKKTNGNADAVIARLPKETADYIPKVYKRLGMAAPVGAAVSSAPSAGDSSYNMTDAGAREKAKAGWEGGVIAALDDIEGANARKPKLNSYEEGLITQGQIDGAGIGDAEGAYKGGAAVAADLSGAQERLDVVASQTDPTPQSNVVSAQASIAEQGALEDEQRRQARDWDDKIGQVLDSGGFGAVMRTLADQEDEVAAPLGWNYAELMDEYETPDMTWEERALMRESRSPQEVQENRSTILRRRYGQAVRDDMSGAANLGYGLLGGVIDPVNAVAGFGVGGAFRAAGVGVQAAVRAGRPGMALASGAAEGALGNMVVDGGLMASGEDIRAQDFLINAGAGLLLGSASNLWSARSASINRLANDYITFNAEVRADALNTARTELGEGTAPAILQRRAEEIIAANERRWREAALMDVPDDDRFFARPDAEETPTEVGGDVPDVGVVDPDFDPANPALGDYTRRREGNLVWSESAELRAGIETAEKSGNASDLFRAVANDTGTPKHLRALAHKLAGIANDTNLGFVAQNRIDGPAAEYAGAYFQDTHTMSAKMARPDIILHEGTHGAIANIQSTPKRLLPEPARAAVQKLEDTLDNVRFAFGQMAEGTTDPNLKLLLDNAQGPLSNAKEFSAYAMTDKTFQQWLAQIPAPTGSTAANAWEWFKTLVGDMLGLTSGERTALDEVLEATGSLLDFVEKNPVEAKGIIDVEAQRLAKMAENTAAPAVVNGAKGLTARQRKDMDAKYNLKQRVSDDSERKLMAEVLFRSERILANNDVDSARLQTWLRKANLEATSTTMLTDESPVSRALAIMLLENPEGAAGRKATTAAIDRAQRFEEYIGGSVRGLTAAKELWLQEQKVGKTASIVRRDELAKRFNSLVTEEMLNRQMGRATNPSRAVKEAADALDPSYLRMLHDQRLTGSVGAQRLPEGGESGYFHRQWQTGKLRGMEAPQRTAFISALKDQLVKTAEYDDEFSNELAIKMLERFERRAMGAANQESTLYSSDTADIVRDSLTAMGLNEEEIAKNLNRFGRGGATYTKGRIELDMLQLYPDGMGGEGKMRLMDFIEHDQEQLVRQYASRAAGEVSLSKYGIQGEAGVKLLRDALRITGAEDKTIKAFDQVMAEFLGKRVGGNGDPNILTNVRLLTQATRLGSASFNQMGVYGDAVAVLGPSRVFEAMGAIPRLRAEILALIDGKTVDNPILQGLETMGADFGTGDYRVMGLGTVDEHASMSGAESVGVLSQAIRATANTVRIMSGHRMLIGVQSRGLAEQIVQKAWQYIRDGVEDKALADMGIDAALAARLRVVMNQVVEFDEGGKVKVFDPDKADPEFNNDMIAFKNTVVRGAGQLLQREFIGETGKWAHDGFLKLLFQFRTFSLVAHQKQLGRNIAVHGGAKAALIVGAAASIAIPIHMARVASRTALMDAESREEYLEEQLSPLVMGRQVMNYVSGLGLLPDVLDIGGGVAAGWATAAGVDLPAWAKPTGGRGSMQQGSLIGGQFAPGIGLVNDAAQAAAGNTGRIRSTIPGNTLPYVIPFFLGAEARMEDE